MFLNQFCIILFINFIQERHVQTPMDEIEISMVMAAIGMRGMGIIDDVEGMTFLTLRQGECVAPANVRLV